MNTEYKLIINDRRIEAGTLMTPDQVKWCNRIIHTASAASAAAGIIPIPVADAIPISAAQITMVVSLGKVFDKQISESAAKSAVAAAASTFVGRNLIKLIPVAGWVASAAVAAGITEAIGWMTAVDFAKASRTDMQRKFSDAQAAKMAAENENIKRNYKFKENVSAAEDMDEYIEE